MQVGGGGIIDTYLRFRAEVDKLQPLMNEMTIGRSNKLSCQQAGGVALDTQALCKEQIAAYFAAEPPWTDDTSLADFLCTLIPGTLVEDKTIAQLRLYKNARTLHRRIIHDPPESVQEWQEFGAATGIVNDFFKFLLTTPVDAQSQVISKLPLKREEVAMMKLRLESIQKDETPEEVSIILEDLNLLSSSINSMYESSEIG